MDDTQNDNQEEGAKRPRSLSTLCILTFIYTGLGCLSSIITPLMADVIKEMMLSSPDYDQETISASLKVIQAGWPYYLTTLLFTLGSMTGAILMWRLRKIGFHFYAFSNLALLFLPMLFLDVALSWYAIFFAMSFICFYGFHLKFMK